MAARLNLPGQVQRHPDHRLLLSGSGAPRAGPDLDDVSPPGTPILLDWQQHERFLGPFYDDETLRSEAAQQNFLMPDVPAP